MVPLNLCNILGGGFYSLYVAHEETKAEAGYVV